MYKTIQKFSAGLGFTGFLTAVSLFFLGYIWYAIGALLITGVIFNIHNWALQSSVADEASKYLNRS
jgi:hypothetical protein